jgi:hypothetical protein
MTATGVSTKLKAKDGRSTGTEGSMKECGLRVNEWVKADLRMLRAECSKAISMMGRVTQLSGLVEGALKAAAHAQSGLMKEAGRKGKGTTSGK